MSLCCDTYTNLGCTSSCSIVNTPIVFTSSLKHTVVFEFNGALIQKEFEPTELNGFMQIPASLFNENQLVTFQLYDPYGVFMGCYRLRVQPGNVSVQPTQNLLPFDTAVSFINVQRCMNEILQGTIAINFNDTDAIQNGTILTLTHSVQHSGQPLMYSIAPITNGITFIGSTLTIVDVSQIGNPIQLDVQVFTKKCNEQFTIDAIISDVQNLVPGYYNHDNIPMDQYVYP